MTETEPAAKGAIIFADCFANDRAVVTEGLAIFATDFIARTVPVEVTSISTSVTEAIGATAPRKLTVAALVCDQVKAPVAAFVPD